MKLLGIVACVGGTMVVTLYKGKMLNHPWPTHLLRPHTHAAAGPAVHHNMVAGTLFLCGSCLGYAFWFIIQVPYSRPWTPAKIYSLPQLRKMLDT
jgi:hypothetical protein